MREVVEVRHQMLGILQAGGPVGGCHAFMITAMRSPRSEKLLQRDTTEEANAVTSITVVLSIAVGTWACGEYGMAAHVRKVMQAGQAPGAGKVGRARRLVQVQRPGTIDGIRRQQLAGQAAIVL